ncbi:START domain-containing protein [Congregibacter sp.]|uniref:START domain-containing protein n=1 Tax=Congregibacter sp. TaxID=2744308 RepID=UPI003F6B1CE5
MSRLATTLAPMVLLLSIGWAGSALSSDWEMQFDEGGVSVETRDVDGSDYKAFRAKALLPASPDDVLARLRDIESYTEWFPDTIEARAVEREGDRWANYVRTDAPWPVKDRDAIYSQALTRTGGTIRIDVTAAPDILPDSKDAVRIRAAAGFWELVDVDGSTAVHWEFHVEPGGNIPSGLANARVLETPKGALQALKEFFAD